MAFGTAYRIWHGISYGLAGMAWYIVWPGEHGMVYGMVLRARNGICYGFVGMAWYMVLLSWPDMVYNIAWRDMEWYMVWPGGMTCIWHALAGMA